MGSSIAAWFEEEISGVGHAGNKTIGYVKDLLRAYNQSK
jgi:hypothetical protein